MTFTVRVRGGDAPTATFLCDAHGYFDVRTREDAARCPECGDACEWALDRAPVGKVQLVTAVSMGKTEARPHAGIMDTRSIADGQRFSGWKRDRASYWEGVRQRKVREEKQR